MKKYSRLDLLADDKFDQYEFLVVNDFVRELSENAGRFRPIII
jgi:hypothetical protein